MKLREKIVRFYENDDNSCMCLKKEKMVKCAQQKWLVLCNLKKLHVVFSKSHLQNGLKRVRFSAFAALSPKWLLGWVSLHTFSLYL